jgi:predicted enzyme related to lactoylglutathione lyase
MDNTVVHFEIPAADLPKMKKFYSNLFGWRIEKTPGPIEYWLIETVPINEKGEPIRPGINVGMFKKEDENIKPVNYISVENIDNYIMKVESLGGKIVQKKQEVPNVGWIAHALDPEGNLFALIQPNAD